MRGGPISRTDDGVLGESGKPYRVYGASVESGAGGGAVVHFHNGTSASGTLMFTATGTASKGILVADIPAQGILFTSGVYVNVDANTANATIFAELVSKQ